MLVAFEEPLALLLNLLMSVMKFRHCEICSENGCASMRWRVGLVTS